MAMKRVVIFLLAVICSTTIYAQNKGDKYIGGTIGVSTTTYILDGESSAGISLAIQPEFGYFVANNFKIGASLGYSYNSNAHVIALTPNLAYYVKVCDNLYYTPGVDVGFVLGVSDSVAMPGFSVSASLGRFEFKPKPKFGISVDILSFSYVSLTYRDKYSDIKFTTNGLNFNFIVNPTVSIKYYF